MTETVSGLHKCQPKNEPEQGEVKNMVVLNMPAKGEKKAWTKIKSEQPEKGGTPYRILNVQKLDWEADQYGNLAFNLEVEPWIKSEPSASSWGHAADMGPTPTAFANAQNTMQQGEPVREYDENHLPPLIEREYATNEVHVVNGVTDARKHLMQDANLMLLCMEAARYVASEWRERHDCELPNEHFQGLCHSFFIKETHEVYWSGKLICESLSKQMPTKPIEPTDK